MRRLKIQATALRKVQTSPPAAEEEVLSTKIQSTFFRSFRTEATNPSTKLKFYIIDPKGGNDYFSLLRLPHLAEPLINDQGRAIDLLKRLVEEMYRRNQLFAKQQVNKLDRYNVKVPPEEQLPVIFLIHDELPQWMVNKEYRQTVTETLTQLATMSRATGIYLIFLAQRPDKDVMSMQIRTNLGNRLV